MTLSDEIRQRVTCREFLEAHGIAVDRRGFCRCPLHGEKTASLKVYEPPTRGWHCHGCHKGGSVIDLCMYFYNLRSPLEAMQRLDADFGLNLIQGKLTEQERQEQQAEITRRQHEHEEREQREKAAYERYLDALFAWLDNERTIDEERPEGPLDDFTDAFCKALVRKCELQYALDCAEDDYMAARRRD